MMNTLDNEQIGSANDVLQFINKEKRKVHSKENKTSSKGYPSGTLKAGQFPLISNNTSGLNSSKARVGSSNYLQDIANMYRGTVLSSSGISSEDGQSPKNDPFVRINKFKNIANNHQAATNSQGMKKPRYSLNEGHSGFSSMMSSGNRAQPNSGAQDLQNPKIISDSKFTTGTLEEVNVLDLVNKGKLSSQQS